MDVVDWYLSIASSHCSPPLPPFVPVSFTVHFLLLFLGVAVKGLARPGLGTFDIGIYPAQQLLSMPNERRAIVSFPRQCLSSLRSSRSTASVRLNRKSNKKTIAINIAAPYEIESCETVAASELPSFIVRSE